MNRVSVANCLEIISNLTLQPAMKKCQTEAVSGNQRLRFMEDKFPLNVGNVRQEKYVICILFNKFYSVR